MASSLDTFAQIEFWKAPSRTRLQTRFLDRTTIDVFPRSAVVTYKNDPASSQVAANAQREVDDPHTLEEEETVRSLAGCVPLLPFRSD
jgi:hypothetical protein